MKKSALRRRRPKAPRVAVWKDIFASDRSFFKKMLQAADLGMSSVCASVCVALCDAVGGLSRVGAGRENGHVGADYINNRQPAGPSQHDIRTRNPQATGTGYLRS